MNGRYVDGAYTKDAIEQRAWARRQLKMAQDGPAPGAVGNSVSASQTLGADVRRVHANHFVADPSDGLDRTIWMERLREALGGTSERFVETALSQLIDASGTHRDFLATNDSLSAALEVIRGLSPCNPIEAAMAVHIAAMHMVGLSLIARAGPTQITRTALGAAHSSAKMERALFSAIEVYHRLRSGNRQVIRIEKVLINEGSQAIIGNIR